jgi:3-deoxy-D-manno-octulosonic-acid transferase
MRDCRDEPRCRLAPLDHPWCVETALRRVSPALLTLVETELWPSWIAAAERSGVPVVLVSGRLSDGSFAGYRRFGGIFRRALGRVAAVGARSELDAERFRALGAPAARVSVTGDLKLEPQDSSPAPADELVALLGDAPRIVAGSTRPGEEALWLDALDRIEQGGAAPALVLVPRQPARAGEVERLASRRGRRVLLRGRAAGQKLAAGDVLVVDTMGELAALYGRSSVAFVGGTLVPVGGHNILEPVLAGRPVLHGPHTESVRHAVEILEGSGAGRVAADADALARVALAWLNDPERTRALGEAGRAALEPHRGSTARSAALIEAVLAERRRT